MRELGCSDKYFYYTSSYGASFELCLGFRMDDFDAETYKRSFGEALSLYPEFRYRPVIKENRLFAEENDNDVIFTDKITSYRFGTDETNGYLFYLSFENGVMRFHFYHGLSDVHGILELLRCSLYFYAVKTGFELSEDEISSIKSSIRTSKAQISSGRSVMDPYPVIADDKAVPEYVHRDLDAFAIPVDYGNDRMDVHGYLYTLSVKEVIERTKKYGVSFVPFINSMIAGSVYKAFDTKGKDVNAMIPVDMRQFFETYTLCNCSDGVFIRCTPDNGKLSVEDLSRSMKTDMRRQMTREYFESVTAGKIKAVKGFEQDETEISSLAKKLTAPRKITDIRPLSYAFTYPGKISYGPGLDRMISEMDFYLIVRGNSVCMYSSWDDLRIRMLTRTDSTEWKDALYEELRSEGLKVTMNDLGSITGSLMNIEDLKHI